MDEQEEMVHRRDTKAQKDREHCCRCLLAEEGSENEDEDSNEGRENEEDNNDDEDGGTQVGYANMLWTPL